MEFKKIYLATILGFSLLVHLPGLTSPLLDYHAYRQTQTASMARNYVRHGMHFFQPELESEGPPQRAGTEFPIYSYLLAILYKLFGMHDILGRLLSSLFAAWGAVFLFGFVRPRLGDSIAWASALTLCALPIHVYFTRSVQPEPMALWGLLGFLYYFDRWRRHDQFKDLMLAILLGAIAPLLKLPFLYLLVPLWAALMGSQRRVSSAAILAAILGLTWAWYHYAKTAPVTVLPLTAQDHWDNIRAVFTTKLWKNHFVSRLPELCTTYPGLLLGGFGAWSLKKAGTLRLWGIWFCATALYSVLLGKYGVIHRYTDLPYAPICAVFIAAGMAEVWGRWPRALTLLLILGIPLHAGLRIKHWYRWEYPWVLEARKVVAQISRPDDLFFTNTREHPVLLYHIERFGYAAPLDKMGLAVVEADRKAGVKFFLTPVRETWDLHPEWESYFARTARLVHRDPEYLIYRFNSAGSGR